MLFLLKLKDGYVGAGVDKGKVYLTDKAMINIEDRHKMDKSVTHEFKEVSY